MNKTLSSETMTKLTRNCGDAEPIPDILNWSQLTKEMISGSLKESEIDELCYKRNRVVRKLIPVLLDQNEAMLVCNILQAELAYPKTLDEFQKWQSMINIYL